MIWARVGWTLLAAFVVGCVLWFLTYPIPPDFGHGDVRGRWVSGRDTLLIGGETWGIFDGRQFIASARDNRMLLHLPAYWPNDDAVVTFGRDSLTMTTGIRTLLHEGDTLRVFRR